MSRVKRGYTARRKRNKVLKAAKGYRGGRSKLIRTAKNAVFKGLDYAYRDRRTKKREFRRLWITRINAAARANGTTYSQLMNAMKRANIEVDRKVLAEIAVTDPAGFTRLVEAAQNAA